MNSINCPNKTFVFETTYDHFLGTTTQVVIVVASDRETASEYIKEKLGFDVGPNELTHLFDLNYKTIYNQSGSLPLKKQAQILYNTGVHYHR